jgi:hypothetical protein
MEKFEDGISAEVKFGRILEKGWRPYKEGVSLKAIMEDGWSRGFHFSQTVEEAGIMGYTVTKEEVLAKWEEMNKWMIEEFLREDS